MEYALLGAIVLPILGAVAAGLSPASRAPRLAVLIILLTVALAAFGGIGALPRGGIRFGTLPWLGFPLGATDFFGVQLDPLSLVMLLVVVVGGFFVVLYSTEYLSPRNRDHPTENGSNSYYFWLLLFVGAMAGVALSPNLLQLFIFWELTTVCSWALISHTQEPRALKAGFKALIMTHIGGMAFLVAIVLLCISVGSVEFSALSVVGPGRATLLFILFLIAAWAKAAQVPFHTWLPDAMTAPTPISCYLHAAAMVKAGVYLMTRLVLANADLPPTGALVAVIAAMVTMAAVVFLFFFQDELKRLLALSTIAHLSYILLGAALGVLGSGVAYRGAVLHIVAHGSAKGLMFLCAGAIAYATGRRRISEMGGLASKMPVVAVCFIVGMLGVVGVPPFGTFWSKFQIITGAFGLPGSLGPFVGAFLLLESMVVFGWLLYVTHKVFFGDAPPTVEGAADPPWQMTGSLLAMAIAVVAAPLAAWSLVNQLW
ncbi:MAG: hypothetical protein FJX75_16375 [Armatimonadetes bacterium]|nr:hypothetical protein [Armatimonadota bacterium]